MRLISGSALFSMLALVRGQQPCDSSCAFDDTVAAAEIQALDAHHKSTRNDVFRNKWQLNEQTSGGFENWAYLLSAPFRARMDTVAMQLARHQCTSVLEVGGYATPLVDLLEQLAFPSLRSVTMLQPHLRASKLSMRRAGGSCVASACIHIRELPFTLPEYLVARTAMSVPWVRQRHDCAVALGYTVPHRENDADVRVLRESRVVFLEVCATSIRTRPDGILGVDGIHWPDGMHCSASRE